MNFKLVLLVLPVLLAGCAVPATIDFATEATPEVETVEPTATPSGAVTLTLPPQLPGPQRECVEEQIGEKEWREVSSGSRNPTAEEASAILECISQGALPGAAPGGTPGVSEQPLPAADAPLPEQPPDEEVTVEVGPVTISTYNPVTITGLEYSTNLYLVARNHGDQTITLRLTSWDEMHQQLPEWVFHFYAFQDEAVELDPGAESTLEYMITNEGEGEAELPFRFQVEQTGHEATIDLTVRSSRGPMDGLPPTAAIQGRVATADGQPVPGAEVSVYLFNGRQSWGGQTDSEGSYFIAFPSIEDLQAVLGPRPLPYHSLDYFLLIEVDGYELVYLDGISPERGQTVTLDVSLEAAVDAVSYRQTGELATDGAYGYWWVLPNGDFSRLAAVQAKHPPLLSVPGHFLVTDLEGQELWRITTGDECWGFDVAPDGRIAAGCHDGNVYLADAGGSLLWKSEIAGRNWVRDVRFSPDGAYLFAGPYQSEDTALLDAATGEPLWTYRGVREWLRNSRFSPDGQRIIAGFGSGLLTMFTKEGVPLWTRHIGQFPMFLAIDAEYNIYAAGKNRELFSFDGDGNLRWRRRIPNHVVTAGAMSADGTLIVLGTVGDWLYAFNQAGDILWQRSGLMGHNSLDMTPNGEWVVGGSGGLYNRYGTLLWQPPGDELIHSTVAISDDGAFIATGDEGSVIHIYERLP